MYRSNDIVQFSKNSIFIRPFVKVGEKAENVKVYEYFLKDTSELDAIQAGRRRAYRAHSDNRLPTITQSRASNPEQTVGSNVRQESRDLMTLQRKTRNRVSKA